MDDSFNEAVEKIVTRDARFARAAYYFVRAGLDHTVKNVAAKRKTRRPQSTTAMQHVTGRELLEGLRAFSLEQFGPMSYTLLTRWGLRTSANFGEIVFNLVEAGILGKTESDTKDDFRDVYELRSAFLGPFLPRLRLKAEAA
jgi:uncharacterized repeat protein (TIGR04138 family)